MAKNFKKKSAHNIYFGINKETGKICCISEAANGGRCGCVCAACGEPLVARKGDVRVHHFAHKSNYECVYANEVAIYKEVARIMDSCQKLFFPPISLQFPSWEEKETLKSARPLSIQKVIYSCEPFQYPPVLEVIVQGAKLRVLISFGNYYTKEDLDIIAAEARAGNYSVLLFCFPNVDSKGADFFTSAHLTDCVVRGNVQSSWVRSALEDDKRKKFLNQAHPPKENAVGYDCPIHIAKYNGMFAARPADCAHCRFNLGKESKCLCAGDAGIQSIEDFVLPPEERQARVQEIKMDNEKKIEEAENRRALEMERRKAVEERVRSRVVGTISFRPLRARLAVPSQAELDAERDRIMASFNPESKEITMDCFNRRWILCERCRKIKESKDMPDYGGPQRGPNRGICRDCNDK